MNWLEVALAALGVPPHFSGSGTPRCRSSDQRNLTPDCRRVVLCGAPVEYRIERARRRTIGIRVGVDGVIVRAPSRTRVGEIETILRLHENWVLRRLERWQSRRRDILPTRWVAGAPIVLSGHALTLAVRPARRRSVARTAASLAVAHPAAHDERAVAAYMMKWLRREAFTTLSALTAEMAILIGTEIPPLTLSGARTRWGSCNAKGEIRLNWRLIHLPGDLARYVVAHEIAHLVHLDHSPQFWATVASLYPDHAAARREIRQWTAVLAA